MGSQEVFQPLTKEDKITVVLYRIGIVLSAVIIACMAVLAVTTESSNSAAFGLSAEILAYGLYVSVGMSVFFIHLYIGKFHTFLKNLYFIGLGCLALLLYIGKGSLSSAFLHSPYSVLLLLPLSGCLGFVTAKEAFCFKLIEGYILAMLMPLYLLLVSNGALAQAGASYGLVLIAILLALFTLRKTVMPLAWDIGDKSAYR
jgi:uncharacterized integral membrane protein